MIISVTGCETWPAGEQSNDRSVVIEITGAYNGLPIGEQYSLNSIRFLNDFPAEAFHHF